MVNGRDSRRTEPSSASRTVRAYAPALPPLQPDQLVKPSRFELRISLIFAAVFIPLGVNVPYFPLWLEANGFGPEQIAIILSAPIFLRVVTTPIISSMADRAKDRANVLIAISVASFLLSLGYFLTPTYAVVLGGDAGDLAVFWTPQSPLRSRFAGAVGVGARLQLSTDAHMGLARLPRRRFFRRHHSGGDRRWRGARDDRLPGFWRRLRWR